MKYSILTAWLYTIISSSSSSSIEAFSTQSSGRIPFQPSPSFPSKSKSTVSIHKQSSTALHVDVNSLVQLSVLFGSAATVFYLGNPEAVEVEAASTSNSVAPSIAPVVEESVVEAVEEEEVEVEVETVEEDKEDDAAAKAKAAEEEAAAKAKKEKEEAEAKEKAAIAAEMAKKEDPNATRRS